MKYSIQSGLYEEHLVERYSKENPVLSKVWIEPLEIFPFLDRNMISRLFYKAIWKFSFRDISDTYQDKFWFGHLVSKQWKCIFKLMTFTVAGKFILKLKHSKFIHTCNFTYWNINSQGCNIHGLCWIIEEGSKN